MSSVLDDLNAQLSGYVQDVEAIKEKIKQVAQNKNISVIAQEDTPITVLNKIDSQTIPIPTEQLNVTQNGSYDVTNYSQAIVNVQGGTTKYAHHIYITWNGGTSDDGFFDCSILIINDNPNNFTQSTLSQFLIDNGFITYPTANNYPCFGSRVIDYQNVWNAIGITANSDSPADYELTIMYKQNEQTTTLGIVPDSPGTLTDTVEQIN